MQINLAHKAFIWGLYVAPSYRNRGIGRELLDQSMKRADLMQGLRQVRLSVTGSNSAAIALYDKMGFRRFGVEPNAMLISNELHDEILMVRSAKSAT